MPTLTLLSVATADTQDVAGFLAHLQGLYAQLVVIDCGMSSKARDTFLGAGAECIQASVTNDEACCLNQGLARATGEWALRVDTNERLSPEARSAIPAVTKQPEAGAGVLGVVYGASPQTDADVWEMRLFRVQGISYMYPVSADVTDSVRSMLEEKNLTQHFLSGLIYQIETLPLDHQEERLRVMAEDPRFELYAQYRLFRLGELFRDDELLDEAAEDGERALEATDSATLKKLSFAGAWLSAIGKHIFADDPASHLSWLDSWAERVAAHAELSFVRGLLCEQLGYRGRARTEYTRCLSRGNPGLNAQYAMIRPTVSLARLDMHDGHAEAALTNLDAVLAYSPKDREALLSLASIARQLGGSPLSDELAQAYRDTYGECLERHVAWGEAALWSGNHEEAIAELTEASALAPEGEHTELLKQALSGSSPQSASSQSP